MTPLIIESRALIKHACQLMQSSDSLLRRSYHRLHSARNTLAVVQLEQRRRALQSRRRLSATTKSAGGAATFH